MRDGAGANRPGRESAGLGVTVSLKPPVPLGVEVKGELSHTAEQRPFYVVASGEGESDPEWRYKRTDTMELSGVHEMALVAEVEREAQAEALLDVSALVRRGWRTTEVRWVLDEHVMRVPFTEGGSAVS